MASIVSKTVILKAGLGVCVLLLAGGAAVAQSATVQLTASPQSTQLPDGQTVRMWGYTCGDAAAQPSGVASAPSTGGATCQATSNRAQAGGTTWQPPLITVPANTTLTINLINRLTFGDQAGQQIPTSIVIDGQLGGGLGAAPQRAASPTHAPQGTTWPGTKGDPTTGACDPGGDPAGTGTFCPPKQLDRVRSFGTEVSVGMAATPLCWGPACGTPALRPGTYLIHSGTQPSIQHPMGLYGVLVVLDPSANTAYGTVYDQDVPILFSEIDPVQNNEVDSVVRNSGFSDAKVWSGLPGACGDVTQPSSAHSCYPPAVNYSPLYYLVNGVSFDRTNIAAAVADRSSTLKPLASTPGTASGVLLRLVNAGLRLHVPAVVNKTMTLLAQDGFKLSAASPKSMASVSMDPGKTFDVVIHPTLGSSGFADATLAIFDRQLSLSTSNQRDGGMQAYLRVGAGAAGGAVGSASSSGTTVGGVDNRTYYCSVGNALAITDPALGLLAGVTGGNGVTQPLPHIYGASGGVSDVSDATLVLQANGTFVYTPTSGATTCGGTFAFAVNGLATQTKTVTIAQCTSASPQGSGCDTRPPSAGAIQFVSNVSTRYSAPTPGVVSGVTLNPSGLALSVVVPSTLPNGILALNANGSFVANGAAATPCPTGTQVNGVAAPSGSTCLTFPYQVKTTQSIASASATATVVFLPASNLVVNVWDAPSTSPGKARAAITDYRWIIEEDRTFWIDPKCQVNSSGTRLDSRGQPCPALPVESLGYNFHTAHMPVVAQGCWGTDPTQLVSCEQGQTRQGKAVACDVGNGDCREDASQKVPVNPGSVYLDPNKRYFISILPGDGVNPTIGGAGGPMQVNPSCDPTKATCAMRQFDIVRDCGAYAGPTGAWEPGGAAALCGHAMGGSQVAAGQRQVDIALQQTPLPTAKIAVFVLQDDNPLNGENDAGGGVDVIAPNEPGLGGFEVKLFDQAGGLGDATGQITYDQFNQPVSNALAHTIDPATGLDACPIEPRGDGLVGMIPTCPKYESDGTTQSPLAGQAVIANLYPGLYEVVATPAADRIARGEEWLQTNTLDGGKPHEAFIKPNEPGYFQEFGPGGFHVSIGFANPAIINARKDGPNGYCTSAANASQPCNNTLNVQVTNTHMSRTPDQRTFSSETYDHYSFTQCYVAVGPADSADFAFQKCTPDGKVSFTGMPPGVFKITVFDQWNDIMLDGLVGTVTINGGTPSAGATTEKVFPVTQWRTNLFTRTFIDQNGTGVSDDSKPGLALVNTNIRYRDGSIGFFNNTDLYGYAGFNEVFPFMNWLVVETSSTRFKPTRTHTVYDAGGPVDCSAAGTAAGMPCSTIAANIANTAVRVPLPADLRVPGARYCDDADCTTTTNNGASTGTVFPPQAWGTTMGWQGLLGQNSFMEFGVRPFDPGENGGISGMVVYASTRPFDDPALSLQLSWEPGIPRVKINLYQKSVDASGSQKLTLVDSTTTASWDDWAQGFRTGATAGTASNAGAVPNINCPGQDATSPFFATLKGSKQWLDASRRTIAYQSQFKCYDGWSMLNQVQPAPYDGLYKFPSITGVGSNGKATTTNCTICSRDKDGDYMLPSGKYVVEVILPPGYELVKEEDKNILLGDVYIAPVSQQFAGFGNIYILPDQAAVNASYNPLNLGSLNTTTDLGAKPRHEGDTGSVEQFWPCVGAERIVPDLNSLFPGAGQAAPFAGAKRRLCDRKEVTLADQSSALTKFFLFSSTHVAGHFTGTITNDFAAEFDPFSPQFGEKFGPPNLPVGMRDFGGNEVARVYSDQWGIYNGLYFSSYSVNPPNPTGYVPQMSIACMNDPGPIPATNSSGQYINASGTVVASKYDAALITDPSYNSAYSNFCYETPFMPGFTAYMDTPVIPTQAFADQYNLPDTEYPDNTPAISSVTSSDAQGPWVSAPTSASGSDHLLTIHCLGYENTADRCSKVVQNPNYSGPNSSEAPYNQKTITRHYGFGSTQGTVSIAGTTATVNSWTNDTIVVRVPTISTTASSCNNSTAISNNGSTSSYFSGGKTPAQLGVTGSAATNYRCGQLQITRGDNNKQSIDAITVTVAGKPPTVVSPTSASSTTFGEFFPNPLQTAIDRASPGDLILVAPGTYRENLIMWKPVRLQGVGAGSVTINADAHPAGKMDSWRRRVACLFGLTIDGVPNPGNAAYDPSGTYTCPNSMHLRADRIPFEAFVGWDAAGNGNLAQILQEPTLMGAYEGAGITVTGRGVRIPQGSNDLWGQGTPGVPGAFPDGSVYLRRVTADCNASTTAVNGRDYGTANFLCNPSRIDGVSIINSSQGGGAVFMHGWNHLLEIANTRITANHGTLTGGVNLGNGETPPAFVNDGTICGPGVATPSPLCPPTGNASAIGANTPASGGAYAFQLNVRAHVHHNMVANNASIGDALFSGTPSGAGGVTISAGGDNYKIDHNWIAGNLSTGDGGGLQHVGVSFNGSIDHNWVLYNQSTNPTLPTSGGGISVVGAQSDRTLANGQECGTTTDIDCPPGIGDGTGPGLVIDANLILGNSAESGTGGGLRLQQINGSELPAFPRVSGQWYDVIVTNNIIVNNVAGWDGGGVSMQDALRVTFVNNTVASNDTTASAGVLFKTLGAINSANTPPGCTPTPDPTQPQNPNCLGVDAPHGPQPAGLVVQAHTPNLIDAINGVSPLFGVRLLCPNNFGYSGGLLGGLGNADCMKLSKPRMVNDLFWQNRTFRVDIVSPGNGNLSQQNLVALSPRLVQTVTGECPAGANYWDIGLRTDDLTAGTIPAGTRVTVSNSLYTSDTQGVIVGSNNVVGGALPVNAPFCNGARIPPENCPGTTSAQSASCLGYNAPPGASETTGLTTLFVFNGIQPTATVDEGHNWLNLSYGPLTLTRPTVSTPTAGEQMVLRSGVGSANGAYSIPGSSAAVSRGSTSTGVSQVATDYFGTTRTGRNDIGAAQYAGTLSSTAVSVTPNPLSFGAWAAGTTSAAMTLSVVNIGTTALAGVSYSFGGGTPQPFSRPTGSAGGSCGTTLAAGAACTVNVVFAPGAGTGGTSYSRSLTVGSTTTGFTPVVVTLTGDSVATRAPVIIDAPTITLPAGQVTGTGLVTFTNSAPAGGSQVNVTNVVASGGSFLTYTFTNGPLAGPDNCTGVPLAPQSSCTVAVRFTNIGSPRGANRTGAISFTSTGLPSPATATLTGFATP